MIQRYRNAHAGTRLDSGRFSHEEGIVDQIVMRKGGAFRQSRGAARELDIDGIVDLNRRRYRVEPLATDCLPLSNIQSNAKQPSCLPRLK